MPIALISDIHSNIEALGVVLKDIEAQGIKEIYCLGDLVGYGPNPAEIVEHSMEWKITLMGNHDEAVIKEAYGFNPVAKQAVAWTRDQLRPGFLSGRSKKERWKVLCNLALTHTIDGALFVHGSPRDPTMEYILRSDCIDLTGGVPDKIRDIFSRFERLCFVGHTHDPGIITEESQFIAPKECHERWDFPAGKKFIVNIGSVGQPRDGDVRSCYAVYYGDRVEWRRVEYEYKTTMQKIFNTPQLDPRAGERLAHGR
ncbi:MAG: metallophosphoesterase family protein [Planctomycetes bacterium]|nr:metallophosphoesterase family protein [Planctomycetota bacterium]